MISLTVFKNNTRDRGFTIVELIVMVVVISVLASITVVAYSEVTGRAQAARARAVVDGYQKLLMLYYQDNDRFPSTGGGVYGYQDVCLGRPDEFPAVSGSFNAGDCIYNESDTSAGGGDGHYRVGAYQPFNANFSAYSASIPNGATGPAQLGNERWRGVRYNVFYSNQYITLEWILPGAHEDWCGPVSSASDGWWGSTWCTLTIDMR